MDGPPVPISVNVIQFTINPSNNPRAGIAFERFRVYVLENFIRCLGDEKDWPTGGGKEKSICLSFVFRLQFLAFGVTYGFGTGIFIIKSKEGVREPPPFCVRCSIKLQERVTLDDTARQTRLKSYIMFQ